MVPILELSVIVIKDPAEWAEQVAVLAALVAELRRVVGQGLSETR